MYVHQLGYWFIYKETSFSPLASWSSCCSLFVCMQEKHGQRTLWASRFQSWLHPWCLGCFHSFWKNLRQNQELLRSVGYYSPAAGSRYIDQQMLLSREEAAPSLHSSLDPGLMKQDALPFQFSFFLETSHKAQQTSPPNPFSSPFNPFRSNPFNNIFGGEFFKKWKSWLPFWATLIFEA